MQFSRLLILLLLAAAWVPYAPANEPDVSLGRTLRAYPGALYGSFVNLITERSCLYTLAGGGAAAGLSAAADDDAREWVLEDEPFAEVEDLGNDVLGNTAWLAGSAAALLSAGWVLDDDRTWRTGAAVSQGLLLDLLLVDTLKSTVGRDRPDKSGTRSFPSGHVAGITTLVVTLGEMYELGPWSKTLLYVLPVLTAGARMQADAHYLSDTAAGAVIGAATALAVTAEWGPGGADGDDALGLFILPEGAGLQYTMNF